MEERTFDDLTRGAAESTSRRGVLGLLVGGAVAAAIASVAPVLAGRKGPGQDKEKGNGGKQNQRCKKLNQSCSNKEKCCKGKKLTCKNGKCRCKPGTVPVNGKCVPPAPECEVDNDCGATEICQNGECVPQAPECVNDADCGDEMCDSGTCVCPAVLDDRCVIRCEGSSECPGTCLCRGTFPGDGDRVVCVDEPGDLCGTPSCDSSDECDDDEICAFTTCDSPAGSGRCFPVATPIRCAPN